VFRRTLLLLALASCSPGSDKAAPPAEGSTPGAAAAGGAATPGGAAGVASGAPNAEAEGANAAGNAGGGSMTPGAPPTRPNTLGEGTTFVVRTVDPILSSAAKPGDRFKARVQGQVLDSQGAVMINGLADVAMRVVRMEKGADGKTGRVEFAVDSALVRGRMVPISATVGEVPHIVTGAGIVLVDRATEIRITLIKAVSAPPLP